MRRGRRLGLLAAAAFLPFVISSAWTIRTAAQSLPAVLDPSFGPTSSTPGLVTFALHDGQFGSVESVFPLPDDRILLGGTLFDQAETPVGFWAGRMLSDGSLDPSYGSSGLTQVQTIDGLYFHSAQFTPGMALVDGRLVVAMETMTASANLFGLQADGSLDPTFGSAATPGHVELAGWRTVEGRKVVTDSTGRLYVLVQDRFLPSQGYALIRLSSSGVIDSGYARGGINWLATSAFEPGRASLNITAGDRPLVFYEGQYIGAHPLAVTRLREDGSVDPTFAAASEGTLGMFQYMDEAVDLAVESSGSMIALASRLSFAGTTDQFVETIQRLNSDGTDAAVWGAQAPLTLPYWVQDVIPAADGTVVIVGSLPKNDGTDYADLVVRRYLPSGVLDPSFNPTSATPGVVRIALDGRSAFAASASVDRNDRILVGGGTRMDWALVVGTTPMLTRIVPGVPPPPPPSTTTTTTTPTTPTTTTTVPAPVQPVSSDRYVALTPARLFDSRPRSWTVDGTSGGMGVRHAGSITTLQVGGRGRVPWNAAAVVLNVTVTDPQSAGFVTVYPCTASVPTTSSVNFVAGETVANLVSSRLSPPGVLCVFTEATTHLVVDVSGYYPNGTRYQAIVPARLLDSRVGEPTVDGLFTGIGVRAAGSVTDLRVAGRGGVDANASAAVLNLTVTEPETSGFVTAYTCGAPIPATSSINFAAGQTVANAIITGLGPSGSVCLFSSTRAHLVVDVSGWYPNDLGYRPLAPARVMDTRADGATIDGLFMGIGARVAGSVTELPVVARDAVASTVGAVVLNVTVTEPLISGFVTVFPCQPTVPLASNLNFVAGQTASSAVITKLSSNGTVCLFTSATVQLVVDISGSLPS